MLEIMKNLTTINRTLRKNRKKEYIAVHYTGNIDDTAYANTQYYKNEYRGSSAHYFVDSKSIWQGVDDDDDAWHCGTNGKYYHPECRNSNSIGIEMCSTKTNKSTRNATDKDWYFLPQTEENTIQLIVYLMFKYNIPLNNVVRHYDVTHKICPAPFVNDENEWLTFKTRIMREYMKQYNEKMDKEQKDKEKEGEVMSDRFYNSLDEIPEYYRDYIMEYIDEGALKGDENGKLNLTDDMVRVLVVIYRMFSE